MARGKTGNEGSIQKELHARNGGKEALKPAVEH